MAVTEEMRLLHFAEDEIKLTDEELRVLLRFFFEARDIRRLAEQVALVHVHRSFTQALLVEAIDASHAMGFVEDLFMSVATGFRGGPKKITQKFAKKALKEWFDNADLDSLWDDIEIYETVRRRLAINTVSVARGLLNGTQSDY